MHEHFSEIYLDRMESKVKNVEPMELHVDALQKGLGAVLRQKHKGDERRVKAYRTATFGLTQSI